MNELNYASLEASKKLFEAGIVLETEKTWFFSTTGWEMVDRYAAHHVNRHYLPAPSMAEVWRELPEGTTIAKDNTHSGAFVIGRSKYDHQNTNPTDALIDLLIWVRKEAHK